MTGEQGSDDCFRMRTRRTCLAGLGALLLATGLAAQPQRLVPKTYTAAQTFEMHFNTPLPKKVRVVHYYGESWGMDPSFAWVLTPVDDSLLKKLVKKAGLRKAAPGAKPNPNVYGWPAWWNKRHVGGLNEVYFRENQGLVRIWVDRPAKQLLIEWINT